MDNYHLTFKNGLWSLKKENSDRAIKNFDNKEDGKEFSRDYLKNHGGSLKIHNADGTFQEERTYPRSKDPKRSKG